MFNRRAISVFLILPFSVPCFSDNYRGPNPEYVIDKLIPVLIKFEPKSDPNREPESVGILNLRRDHIIVANLTIQSLKEKYQQEENVANTPKDQVIARTDIQTGEIHFYENNNFVPPPGIYWTDFEKSILRLDPFTLQDARDKQKSKLICKIYLLVHTHLIDDNTLFDNSLKKWPNSNVPGKQEKNQRLRQLYCDSEYGAQLAVIWKYGKESLDDKITADYKKTIRNLLYKIIEKDIKKKDNDLKNDKKHNKQNYFLDLMTK